MKKELALRYLLLRHMKQLQHELDNSIFLEVTTSLTVTSSNGSYILTWQREEAPHTTTIPANEFTFYVRGDDPTKPSLNTESMEPDNAKHAKRLCKKIAGLNIEWPLQDKPKQKIKTPYFLDLLIIIALFFYVPLHAWIGVGLISIYILSRHAKQYDKIITPFILLVMAFTSFKGTAFTLALAATLFHFLDPDKHLRSMRFILSALAAFIALSMLSDTYSTIHLTYYLAALLGATLIAAYSTFWGIHNSPFATTSPFIIAGITLDIAPSISILFLAYVIATAYQANTHPVNPR